MHKTKIYFISLIFILFHHENLLAKNNYFEEAEKLFYEKKYEKSQFKFEKDIVFNPKNEKSYLYLAKIFKEKKNDIMEEQNLETVILLNPQNEEALYLLALFKIKKSEIWLVHPGVCSRVVNFKHIFPHEILPIELC